MKNRNRDSWQLYIYRSKPLGALGEPLGWDLSVCPPAPALVSKPSVPTLLVLSLGEELSVSHMLDSLQSLAGMGIICSPPTMDSSKSANGKHYLKWDEEGSRGSFPVYFRVEHNLI